jgi:thiamine-monophosphate kinase
MPLSEFEIIARCFAPIAAPGAFGLLDDAASLSPPPGRDLVLTKDMLVAGMHFFPGDPPAAIARKALRVNLSDLAAKGAEPIGFMLGIALARETDQGWIDAFAAGLAADAASYGLALFGGDTVSTSGPVTVSITAFGSVPAGGMVRRLGASAGDRLFVTGRIGDAALGLRLRLEPEGELARLLAPEHREALLEAYLLPQPRTALAAAVQRHASAAMDVSDGFVGDLTKMLSGAGLGARVRLDRVPHSPAAQAAMAIDRDLESVALCGGDDYELLVATPPGRANDFVAACDAAGVPASPIGDAAEDVAVRFVDAEGRTRDFTRGSFSHF